MDDNGNDLTGLGEFIIAKNRDGTIGIKDMKVVLETSEWNSYDKYFDNLEPKQPIYEEPF